MNRRQRRRAAALGLSPIFAMDEASRAVLATDPPVSEAQRRAMYAAREGKSTLGIPKKVGEEFVGKDQKAAGTLYVAPDGDVLVMRRSGAGGADHGGTWSLPGGRVEDGETALDAATREADEETGGIAPAGPKKPVDAREGFTTFAQPVTSKFVPTLDAEHSGYAWASLDALPQPLHPGLDATLREQLRDGRQAEDLAGEEWDWLKQGLLDWLDEEREEPEHAHDHHPLAMDRSTREFDEEGRLRVGLNNISKATVNPYRGDEIPGYVDLGLKADQVYHLLRDPEELRKAAPTFNGLPVLSKHVPVDVENHEPDLVMGALGTDAEWDAPYLRNSLILWAAEALKGVETRKKHELSSAYRYDPDMTPGVYEGQPYDGVMRNIRGNHVALVETGRAGPDVVVGDQALQPKESREMPATKIQLHYQTATALVALRRHLKPLLAQDAQVRLAPVFVGVMPKNWKANKPKVKAALDAALKGKLARDADLPKMHKFVDSLDDEMEEPDDDVGLDEPDVDGLKDVEKPDDVLYDSPEHEAVCKHFGDKGMKLSKDDVAQIGQMMKKKEESAEDAEEDPDDPDQNRGKAKGATEEGAAPVDKKAMDAALKKAVSVAVANTKADLAAVAEARELVRPHLGAVAVTMDSADAIYRACLQAKYPERDFKDLGGAALKTLVELIPIEGAPKVRALAADSAGDASFAAMFPEAAQPMRLV